MARVGLSRQQVIKISNNVKTNASILLFKMFLGALEGQYKRATGKLMSFSEQNLLDCVYARDGCTGGDEIDSFKNVLLNKGIQSEISYPYTNKWSGKCQYNKNLSINVGITGFKYVIGEDDLKAAVATIGPIAISNRFSIQPYVLPCDTPVMFIPPPTLYW